MRLRPVFCLLFAEGDRSVIGEATGQPGRLSRVGALGLALALGCLAGTGAALSAEGVTLDLGGGVSMRFNPIPAGRFTMGSPPEERGRDNDELQRPVTITKPFYMGIHAVTQLQWLTIMGTSPSRFSGIDLPVERVSWDDAAEFCKKLSEKTGRTVRLPTEAEWEYACRAGTTTAFNTGDDIKPEQANFNESRKKQTTPVGSYPANALGLFDMHGNVWEWCADWYGFYPEGAATDPKGPERSPLRTLRGGSWSRYPRYCRSANRSWLGPDSRDDDIGFRAALD